ncbi:MAG: exodeoxyribonuclease III [Gammaproteobacteria bacterium]|nr:MAG: exodeoxyribonuclease III [Gammaproteobacteria bacterium]
MKIATWNVNSLKVRIEQVLHWLQSSQCDILCLQETKLTDEHFPAQQIQAAGYHVAYSGQKTYNGVAIIAKQPITQVQTDIPGLDDPQRRIMCASVGNLRVLDLYVVNGKAVDTDKYHYKLNWLEKVTAYIQQQMQQHEHLLVLGDFNIAPEDRDVHNPLSWRDKILCSQPERAALQGILDLGLSDLFRQFEQPDNSFSWWDYRSGGFEKNQGLRIDLILGTSALRQHCTACSIDTTPRTWERPSDHAPVLAAFSL